MPDIGFVVCDPTWDEFSQIDYIHLTTSVGANFGGGLEMELPDGVYEIPPYPMVLGSASTFNKIRWSYTIQITVLEANIQPSDQFVLDAGLVVGSISVVIVIAIVVWAFKKKSD